MFEQQKLRNDESYWRIVTDYDGVAVGPFKLMPSFH